jgi:peptidoglycan/xylan/chitin deacetylase (PgdA/CDA1 family)
MILTFHQLTSEAPKDLFQVGLERFEKYLEIVTRLNSPARSGFSPLKITFDDGHISNFELGLPLLGKHSIRGMFFIVSGWVGKETNAMTWEQLRDLVALGHQIGSHSWSHPPLVSCSDAELLDELVRSKDVLQDKLGTAVEDISVPYGRWDSRILAACSKAGYRHVYTSDPWMSPWSQEGLSIFGRLTVRSTMDSRQLLHILTAKGPSVLLLRAPYAAKQALKQVIGDKLYQRLRQYFAHADEPQARETR